MSTSMIAATLGSPKIHCEVYRSTSTIGRAGRKPWTSHAWFVTCRYDWGTVNTLCRSWQGAMDHADREIRAVAKLRTA